MPCRRNGNEFVRWAVKIEGNKPMRKLRIFLAAVSFTALTVLFLDTTGVTVPWVLPAAKVQFLPALVSLQSFTGRALAVVLAVLGVTALCGRIYCSTLCPLGVFQDLVALLRRLPFVKRVYGYQPAHGKVRLAALAATLAAVFCGFHFAVLAPYGIYGRALTVLALPFVKLGNNALVPWCHAHGCWAVKTIEVVIPGLAMIVGAASLMVVVGACALAGGRLWCNTVCPVGTILGWVAKCSRFRPKIDAEACVKCGACVRVCKSRCLDLARGQADMSRCVVCFNCSKACKQGAIKWK